MKGAGVSCGKRMGARYVRHAGKKDIGPPGRQRAGRAMTVRSPQRLYKDSGGCVAMARPANVGGGAVLQIAPATRCLDCTG